MWQFPEGSGLEEIKYYSRVGNSYETRYPLRSTNQENDPGATDYVVSSLM